MWKQHESRADRFGQAAIFPDHGRNVHLFYGSGRVPVGVFQSQLNSAHIQRTMLEAFKAW
jgi:hypothetical protein